MKHKYLKGIFLLIVIALVAGKTWQMHESPSQLLIDNIEALAGNEGYAQQKCWGSGTVTCPLTGTGVKYVVTHYSEE